MINWQFSQTQPENAALRVLFLCLKTVLCLNLKWKVQQRGFLKLKELLDQMRDSRAFTSVVFTKISIHCRYCKCQAFMERESILLFRWTQHFYVLKGNHLCIGLLLSLPLPLIFNPLLFQASIQDTGFPERRRLHCRIQQRLLDVSDHK